MITHIPGFPLSFGVFQSYYTQHPLFSTSSSIPTIGALALGLPYLILPLTTPLCLRYPTHHVSIMFLGWLLCLLGLLLASFATQVWHLILTQAAMYGIGWCICYTPFLMMLNEWWVRRRGLVYGLLFAASGTSGLVLPFFLEALLARWGFRAALRSYAIGYSVISAPAFWLIRPRRPPPPSSYHHHHTTLESDVASPRQGTTPWYAVLLTPSAIVITLSTITQGLVFPYPPTFLPSYATALALPPSAADSLLAIRSFCQVLGLIVLGWFSDHVSHHIPHSLSSLISGFACLLLWGPAKGYVRLGVFAAVWGFFASPYTVFWTRMSQGLAGESGGGSGDVKGRTMAVYSWLSFVRGVTVVVAGPLSELLVAGEVNGDKFGLGEWTGIVWFSVVMLFMSATGGLMWVFEKWKGRARRLDQV
jgi:MFS family permease